MKLKNIYSTAKKRASWSHLFFFLIGSLFATVICNWSYFSFDDSIEISDFFSAVFGGYIGLYIGSKLTSKVSSDRTEKDLIISELQVSRTSIIKLIAYNESGLMPFDECTNLFKNASSAVNHVIEMITSCEFEADLVNEVKILQNKIRAVYRKTTIAAPLPSGALSLDNPTLLAIGTELNNCNKACIKLIFAINRT